MRAGQTPALDVASEILDLLLPNAGAGRAVGEIRLTADRWGVGWRTVETAKRRAGNIRSVKQEGRRTLPWIWVRE